MDLKGKGPWLSRDLLSPNGQYVILTTNGLAVHQFIKSNFIGPNSGKDHDGTMIQEGASWTVPLETVDIGSGELAKRSRFESDSIIRFLTPDGNDLLFALP